MVERYEAAHRELTAALGDPYLLFAIERIQSFAILPLGNATEMLGFLLLLAKLSKDDSASIYIPPITEGLLQFQFTLDQVANPLL